MFTKNINENIKIRSLRTGPFPINNTDKTKHKQQGNNSLGPNVDWSHFAQFSWEMMASKITRL